MKTFSTLGFGRKLIGAAGIASWQVYKESRLIGSIAYIDDEGEPYYALYSKGSGPMHGSGKPYKFKTLAAAKKGAKKL